MWAAIPFLTCVFLPNWRAATDERPELTGPEEVVASADGRFLVHYTLEGDDAPKGDVGNDGVPEVVTWALEGLEIGVERFEDRGYRELIGDDGDGGSNAIDVYIKAIDANGYAHPFTVSEADGNSCYMRLDNALTLDGVMQSVTIHELHHCVQYRYTALSHSWIYEATATFEQYRTYLDEKLAAAVVVLYSRRLQDPQLPMDRLDGDFEYAGMIAMQFWEQFGGLDPVRVPELWEALADEPDWRKTFNNVAQHNWDLSWNDTFLEFATWNAFACANNDGAHYDETELPCNEFVSVPFRSKKWDNGELELRLKLTEPTHSADYWELDDEEPLLDIGVDCEAPRKKAEMAMRLVTVDQDGNRTGHVDAAADDQPLSLRLTEPRSAGGSLRLIGASVGDGTLNVRCSVRQLQPEGSPASGCGCSNGESATAYWWLLIGVAGLRRRAQADRPHSSSSSRSSPR